MTLPVTVLPSGYTALMRQQAELFFTEPILVYETTITYNTYGQQVIVSGLRFAVSGYAGAVTGKDLELLSMLKLIGTENESRMTVLLPFAHSLRDDDTIVIASQDYRVIWNSANTQDSVQLYQKAIVARKIISPERRQYNG